MALEFARRMEYMKASDIRELLKVTERGDIISLAGGLPAPEMFPVEELSAITETILRESGQRALQYSPTEGYAPLRAQIAARMNRLWQTRFAAEQILVTTGSQQGLDLLGKLFIDEDDEVLCESPTYVGAIQGWNPFRPRWVEVPTDDDGMDIAALEELLDRCRRPKMIYVVPNFQNPSGRTWSIKRRRLLMAAAGRRMIPVVEDNPYGELRFEEVRIPSLKTFDEHGLVICLGTFSKIFCPGLRLGWVAAESLILGKLVILKQGADLHSSTLHQMQVSAYFERPEAEKRIEQITALYRDREEAMVHALDRELPEGTRFSRPQGGLFLWVELPAGLEARRLLARCLELGVAFVPGSAFYPNGGGANTLRLNFSNMPAPRIEEGVRRLGQAVREMVGEGVIPETLPETLPEGRPVSLPEGLPESQVPEESLMDAPRVPVVAFRNR